MRVVVTIPRLLQRDAEASRTQPRPSCTYGAELEGSGGSHLHVVAWRWGFALAAPSGRHPPAVEEDLQLATLLPPSGAKWSVVLLLLRLVVYRLRWWRLFPPAWL
jgi:hypothetical protein